MIRYSTPTILTSLPDYSPNKHTVAFLEIDRDELAAFVAATWTNGDHLSFSRLLFGRVRNDDSACGFTLDVDARNHDAVVKRPKFDIGSPKGLSLLMFRIERGGLQAANERDPSDVKWCVFSTRQVRVPIRRRQTNFSSANILNLLE